MLERRLWQIALAVLVFVTISYFRRSSDTKHDNLLVASVWDNLSLTEAQCNAAFPGLTHEIDEAVARGPFELKQSNNMGPLQGRIQAGELYILNAAPKAYLSKQMLSERTSALHQLHRALVTSPEPLPDTIFSLNIRDSPFATSWSYSHAHDTTTLQPGDFIMPHFAFWSWPLPFIGSLRRGLSAITTVEATTPFATKLPRAIWRGTAWFNDPKNADLRKNLLKVTREKPWADVEALQWGNNAESASNALAIEDFCRYKYILYTEGVTYSGRLLFHQACASVVISPPIAWKLHNTHLVKPVFSSALLGTEQMPERKRKGWEIGDRNAVQEANMVFVASDWSDLEATVEWLEKHPDIAEGIARRQRETFANGGHLSPAAETCYWRALIRGWSAVVQLQGLEWERELGVPWEEYSLSEDSVN